MKKILKLFFSILLILINTEVNVIKANSTKSAVENNITVYNAEELLTQILGLQNVTSRQSYKLISFEGQSTEDSDVIKQSGFVKFEDDRNDNHINNHITFEEQPYQEQTNNPDAGVQTNNKVQENNQEIPQKPLKKRRRRRKPKRQNIPRKYGIQNSGYPNANGYNPNINADIPNVYNPGIPNNFNAGLPNNYNPGIPNAYNPAIPNNYNPGIPNNYNAGIPNGYNPGIPNNYNPGIPNSPGGFYRPQYRPPRRRRPANIAEDALTAVTKALGSVAQYDDFQCVPRLLCEVAGGKGPSTATQTSSILSPLVNLQPLITLLAAYNGLSSSPLFVFGRAVFLGVTSKGNTGTCRYAYPLCPTDPDKLVDYLNNHNGGFFRFFNGSPQPQFPNGQQDLQQFYSQLSNIPNGNPNQGPQNYGLYPMPEQQQNYGLYSPENNGFDSQRPAAAYGLYNPGFGNKIRDPEKYGAQYPYKNNGFGQHNYYKANEAAIDNRIEKRIQNNPSVVYVNTDFGEAGFKFPENVHQNGYEKKRETKSLKFPNEGDKFNKYVSYDEHVRKGKGFAFPEDQSNRQYIEYFNYPPYTPVGVDNYNKYNEDVYYVDGQMFHSEGNIGDDSGDGSETIYILRGNGDPNNPEIIKLKPGQKLNL